MNNLLITEGIWMINGKICIDFNNMLQERIGEFGLSAQHISAETKMLPQVHHAMCEKQAEMTWRALPYHQQEIILDMEQTAKGINEKFDNFVIFGIGGSALGPRALFSALKHWHYNELPKEKRGGVRFYIEDNIDPDRMNALFDIIDVKRTAFNVITKSGSTVETMSQFIIIIDMLKNMLGDDYKNNIFITTDISKGDLRKIADEHGFKTFIVPNGVGGRFSVFCPVGLLGAAVLNMDIKQMMQGAADMDVLCSRETDNPAYLYALLFSAAMKKGVNISVMMPYADALLHTAQWYAQLWAESLGKRFDIVGNVVSCGQTPVAAIGVTDQHSQIQLYTEGPYDKIITFIHVDDFHTQLSIPKPELNLYNAEYITGSSMNKLLTAEAWATEYAVTKAGKMNMKITLKTIDAYSIGALMFFFEMATAAAGEFLQINAFDQPGVEEGKNATYALMGKKGFDQKKQELQLEIKANEAYVFNL
jgi:glucose-6-phosphate isomerase